MSLNTGVSCAVNQAMKAIIRIPRPWLQDERIIPVPEALPAAGGDSFPSGHTVRAGCAYGSYGMELIRKKEKTGILFLLLILMIGFSRNWLGVHTAEDVLVGILIFVAGYFLTDKTLKWTDKGGVRDLILCVSACILICLPMIWLGWLSNSGSCMGFFLGWLFEKHLVQFEILEDNSKKMKRALPGFLGILLISTAFQSALWAMMKNNAASFFSSFFLSFFIMAIYPAMYTWSSSRKKSVIAILTTLFFLFPFGVQFAKSESQKEIAVIGHRGFAAAAPENTMPAFEKALTQGVNYIELDVQLSADRQIVVCHDSNLARTAGVDIELSLLTLEEIKQLDAGSWFSEEYAGTSIPTLSEVLELIKESNVKIYLELKDIGDDAQFPLEVYQLTQDYQMEDRCVFASFQYNYLKVIKETYPEAKILLNTTISETTLPEDYPSDYYGVYYNSFSERLARAIHEHGSVVFVWTVDEADQIKDAIENGTDGLCSNWPDRVQEYLKKDSE